MAECITREAAINAVLLAKSDADITLVPGSFTNGFIEGEKIRGNAILNALADVPASDVVEVVRCKDCKHWGESAVSKLHGSCDVDALLRHRDFFCAAGEKVDAVCDTCRHGAHWDGAVICGKDGQRHERDETCKEG